MRRVEGFAPVELRRLRWIAWLLDQSIPVGRYRVGLDPLLGLIPGGGDAVGAVFSLVILYDAARLGLPTRVLFRMVGNIFVEAVVGVVPLLGDVFDFVWKANTRNLALVEKFYDPLRAERPPRQIGIALVVATALLLLFLVALGVLVVRALWLLIERWV